MRKTLLILALLLAIPARATVAFVTGSAKNNTANATSVVVTAQSTASGNDLIVIVAIRTTTVTVSGSPAITDNGSPASTYTFRGAINSTTNDRVEMWSARGIAAGITSVTVNLSATSKVVACIAEYSGVLGLGNVITAASFSQGDVNLHVNNIIVAGFAGQGTNAFSANVGNLRTSSNTTGSSGSTNVGGALNDNTSSIAVNAVTNAVTTSDTFPSSIEMELQGVAPSGNLVQVAGPQQNGWTGTTNPTGFALPNTAGNLIVVSLNWNTQTITASVADTKGNPYSSAIGPVNWNGTAERSQIFYAKNIGAQTANVVTPTFSSSTSSFIRIFEYSGQDTNPVDVTASGTGTVPTGVTGTLDSGAATTNFANELIFGAFEEDLNGTRTLSANSGFSGREDSNTSGWLQEDKAVTSTGSYNATASLGLGTGATNWVALMVAFKNASQPGGVKRLPVLGVGAMLPALGW